MVKLLPHNVRPFDELCQKMAKNGKCAYVSATGTGKSYVAAKYAENKDTLILVPSLSIARNWHELLPEADVLTYQAGLKRTPETSKYELLICDEMHHLGAAQWSKVYDAITENWSGEILGLSATPIRYLDNCRDMAEEYFGDSVVCGYDLPEAVKEGILPGFEYITALYNTPDVQKYQNEQTSRLISRLNILASECSFRNILKKNLKMPAKTIVFCPSIDDIDTIKRSCEEIFPDVSHTVLFCRQSNSQKKNSLASFSEVPCGFLYVVDMLNEGVHTDGVNSVIMFRKTESPTVYLQQLGRALSSTSSKSKIKIFDFVANHSSVAVYRNVGAATISLIQEAAGLEQVIVRDYALSELELFKKIQSIFNKTLPWTPEEDNIIVENQSKSAVEIAGLLPDRTPDAVSERRRALLGAQVINYWTPEEDEIVRKNANLTPNEISKLLPGRTAKAIRTRKSTLGVCGVVPFWSEKELQIIRDNIGKTDRELLELLPGRTIKAIGTKRKELFPGLNRGTKPWTENEVEVLRKNPDLTSEELAALLPGRTAASIRSKRAKLFERTSPPAWTKEEESILKENFGLSVAALSQLLPGRTKASIERKLYRMGLTQTQNRWTPEEDKIIFKNACRGMSALINELPSRTQHAIKNRAQVLGVHLKSEKEWTKEELAILTKNINVPADELVKLIPGRSRNAIIKRKCKLRKTV